MEPGLNKYNLQSLVDIGVVVSGKRIKISKFTDKFHCRDTMSGVSKTSKPLNTWLCTAISLKKIMKQS